MSIKISGRSEWCRNVVKCKLFSGCEWRRQRAWWSCAAFYGSCESSVERSACDELRESMYLGGNRGKWNQYEEKDNLPKNEKGLKKKPSWGGDQEGYASFLRRITDTEIETRKIKNQTSPVFGKRGFLLLVHDCENAGNALFQDTTNREKCYGRWGNWEIVINELQTSWRGSEVIGKQPWRYGGWGAPSGSHWVGSGYPFWTFYEVQRP